MGVLAMDEPREKTEENPAAKEKIREFCYELALALRRITGKEAEVNIPPSMPLEDKSAPSPDRSGEEHNK
jgi:hypothetical protein